MVDQREGGAGETDKGGRDAVSAEKGIWSLEGVGGEFESESTKDISTTVIAHKPPLPSEVLNRSPT